MKNWYYLKCGTKKGPCSEAKIKELIKKGKISADTFLWSDESTHGEKASDINCFEFEPFRIEPEKPDKSLAVTSMVLGLVSIVFCLGPLSGIPGFIVGIFALVNIYKGRAAGKTYANIGMITSFAGIFTSAFILSGLSGGKESYKTFACSNQMKSFGLAMKNYAIDNNDYLPPYDGAAGFELLRINEYLADPQAVICPNTLSVHQKYNMPLTEDTVGYVYRGGAKDIPEDEAIPVAWDKEGNHKDCGNVLYADGRVVKLKGKDWTEHLKTHNRTEDKK